MLTESLINSMMSVATLRQGTNAVPSLGSAFFYHSSEHPFAKLTMAFPRLGQHPEGGQPHQSTKRCVCCPSADLFVVFRISTCLAASGGETNSRLNNACCHVQSHFYLFVYLCIIVTYISGGYLYVMSKLGVRECSHTIAKLDLISNLTKLEVLWWLHFLTHLGASLWEPQWLEEYHQRWIARSVQVDQLWIQCPLLLGLLAANISTS
jgi:hypothetical protein